MAVSPSSSSPAEPRNKQKQSTVLGALRAAVTKVRFLLSFSATRWMLLSSIRGAAPPRRGISFNVRSPSLLDAEGGIDSSPATSRTTSRSASMGTATTRSVSSSSSSRTGGSPEVLTRTSSSSGGGSPAEAGGGDDDIDRRAEEFIANFYRQLRMERQVSLQLRYVRGNSWDKSP